MSWTLHKIWIIHWRMKNQSILSCSCQTENLVILQTIRVKWREITEWSGIVATSVLRQTGISGRAFLSRLVGVYSNESSQMRQRQSVQKNSPKEQINIITIPPSGCFLELRLHGKVESSCVERRMAEYVWQYTKCVEQLEMRHSLHSCRLCAGV